MSNYARNWKLYTKKSPSRSNSFYFIQSDYVRKVSQGFEV